MLGHAGAIKHSMGLSMPGYFILILILRNSQKQSPKIKVYRYRILSKGKHWRGVHQEPHQEKAGGTMKTASTWQKLAKNWQLYEYK